MVPDEDIFSDIGGGEQRHHELEEYMPRTQEEEEHIKHTTDESIRPEHAREFSRVSTSPDRRRPRGSSGASPAATSQGTPMRELEPHHPVSPCQEPGNHCSSDNEEDGNRHVRLYVPVGHYRSLAFSCVLWNFIP